MPLNSAQINYKPHKHRLLRGRSLDQAIRFISGILIFNSIHLFIKLGRFCTPARKKKAFNRIVMLGFGGIGNHVATTPALQHLKTTYPGAEVIFFAGSRSCAVLLSREPSVASFHIMDIGHMQSFINFFKAGNQIRAYRPDVVIAAAGTDPVKGSIISFYSRARFRIGENWHGRGFLYTHRINVDLGIPESEQNMKLVNLIAPSAGPVSPRIILTAAEIDEARNWFDGLNLPAGRKMLGIHPGSGVHQKWKRWDLKNFVKVSDVLSSIQKAVSIFFLGPEEKDLYRELKNQDNPQFYLSFESESIRTTAAKISCCDLFLSNDSGLRHIAASLNVKTIGIFGPTVREKNAVGKGKDRIIYNRNTQCSPCHYTSWHLACGGLKPCLRGISAEQVAEAVRDHI